jgi:integrase/recombinase XerD
MTNSLAEHVESYLALRRAVGYRLREDGRLLPSFATYLAERHEAVVTSDLALSWAAMSTSRGQAARRLAAVRQFALYMTAFEPATQVPPSWLLPSRVLRVRPYLYSPAQTAALISAAERLQPAAWGATMATLVGLLAAAGLRPGEAYRADRAHLDLEAGELAVIESKYHKSRLLPLHPSTTEHLGRYLAIRDGVAEGGEPALLVGPRGQRLSSALAAGAFRSLIESIGITAPPGRRPPRMYDFRHTFAVNTLIDWHRAGVDVQSNLPVLSAYLGHRVPANTFWYLEAAPELLGLVAARVETSWKEVS